MSDAPLGNKGRSLVRAGSLEVYPKRTGLGSSWRPSSGGLLRAIPQRTGSAIPRNPTSGFRSNYRCQTEPIGNRLVQMRAQLGRAANTSLAANKPFKAAGNPA